MKVDLLAHTTITPAALDLLQYESGVTGADHLAEVAGRQCYRSWHRPNPNTAENSDYLAHILEIDHTSIMEHATATFRLTGVSRNLLVELTRHRHLSPSVVSQRYVDESFGELIVPPELLEDDSLRAIVAKMINLHAETRQLYADTVQAMISRGYERKRARQAARAILPGGHETAIIMTGNIRAWRHVVHMRYSVHADVEICLVAEQILGHLRKIAPHQVQDISDGPRS